MVQRPSGLFPAIGTAKVRRADQVESGTLPRQRQCRVTAEGGANLAVEKSAMRDNESALAVCCQEIAARLKRGEEAALEDFLRHLGSMLAGQLRKRFGTSLTAEDIED